MLLHLSLQILTVQQQHSGGLTITIKIFCPLTRDPVLSYTQLLKKHLMNLLKKKDRYLLSRATYPDLHTLIFTRLGDMQLFDSFIMPTHSMVLAKRNNADEIKTVATHPAPQSLVAHQYDKVFANSNADAAVLCKAEKARFLYHNIGCGKSL